MKDLPPSGRYTDLTSEVPGEEETEFDNHGDLPEPPEQAADSKRARRQSWSDRDVVDKADVRPADTTQQHDNESFARSVHASKRRSNLGKSRMMCDPVS